MEKSFSDVKEIFNLPKPSFSYPKRALINLDELVTVSLHLNDQTNKSNDINEFLPLLVKNLKHEPKPTYAPCIRIEFPWETFGNVREIWIEFYGFLSNKGKNYCFSVKYRLDDCQSSAKDKLIYFPVDKVQVQ